jgi:hypothetical protein
MEAKKLREFLDKYPNAVEIVPLEEVVVDSARGSADRPGTLKLAIPDAVVKNLRGDPSKRDTLLLVHIPHDLVEREASPIILPGL